FALKVLVLDSVSRQPLPGASVSVYLNHSLTSSAHTEPSGEVLFWIRSGPRPRLTLLGDRRGYVPRPLAWSTSRRPVLSVVTLLLLPQAQGNVWLYQDSVLIRGKPAEGSSHPQVTFPKDLLLTSNITSVTAYLTLRQRPPGGECSGCTPGLLSSRSGVSSVALTPLASVSVLLFCGPEPLQVRGPVQISLPLQPGLRLRPADTVPAWTFNFNTGAWENRGLGRVRAVGDELLWTYTASQLGHWMAAPPPSSEGLLGYQLSLDLGWYHTYLLMGALGAALLLLVVLLSLLLCHCRRSQEPRGRTARFTRLTVVKRDQSTSTHLEAGLTYRPGDRSLLAGGVLREASSGPRPHASYNIYVEEPASRPAHFYRNVPGEAGGGEEGAWLRDQSELNSVKAKVFVPDKLVNIFSPAVAVVQAPELFGTPEQQLLSGCKAATFPRKGGEYDAHAHPEPASKDGFTQMLAKAAASGPRQSGQDEPRALDTPPPSQAPSAGGWGRYSSLLESSVSVPGTLNEAAGLEAFGGGHGVPGELQGISERTLLELTRGKPLLSHPRAWFVSLDGKPAAQVRHSIIELQGGQRRPSSNDTSLDSGVDMNEPLQSSREVDRDRLQARASSLSRHGRGGRGSEEQDLSSSESGTTATCTPEDASLRSILDGSAGAVPNIPEELEDTDACSPQGDGQSSGAPPPSRRLRKLREKAKSDCKPTREGRPQSRRS
uniref:Family with sequence similarity 171 member B n=1 Tax=Tetraodon nigroviridis TaxID=99883 RepID=H3DIH4_TETNG